VRWPDVQRGKAEIGHGAKRTRFCAFPSPARRSRATGLI
jgi:hypothetical protein